MKKITPKEARELVKKKLNRPNPEVLADVYDRIRTAAENGRRVYIFTDGILPESEMDLVGNVLEKDGYDVRLGSAMDGYGDYEGFLEVKW